ncbi:MAG: 3'-5' exonuclease, partial [bacterium]|nr:3'-5' exonuclease [bacterium]
ENSESDAVARARVRRAVPYRIESARDILDDALVRKFLRLLKAVHDLSDDEALFAALHLDFLGIAPLDVYKVSAGRGARRRGLATIMADRAALEALGVEAPDAMGALAEKLLSWYRRARTDDALSVLTMIIEESGFSRALLKDDGALERIEVLRRLTETARTLAVGKRDFLLGDFLRYIETLESHGIPIKYERPRALLGAVRLMTAHGAKGLEFDYVFLVNVTDGHWGNKRSRELFRLPSLALAAYEQGDEPERSEGLHAVEREPRLKGATIVSRIGAPEGAKRLKGADELPDALDEERRLFYVALTRARRMVYLSHADEDLEGRERRPSQFLFEMKPELLAEGDGA